MPYRSGGDEQHLTQEGSVVEDLVRQFADPYAFLRELVQNSIDAGARKIRVHMDRAERGAAAWSVEDDGCGMNEQVRRHIFEPFFTTRRGQGGSGLGMHIVYNLAVQALGGSIECETAPGKGARFVLRIPLRDELP